MTTLTSLKEGKLTTMASDLETLINFGFPDFKA